MPSALILDIWLQGSKLDGIQVLDVTGPAAVFGAANDAHGSEAYRVHIVSPRGGLVQSNSAIAIASTALAALDPAVLDTVLVAGGSKDGMAALLAAPGVGDWLARAHRACRRLGSICTGAYALAHFGLVDGQRIATHWSLCDELGRRFPRVDVDPRAIFVDAGHIWSSAGVTTGIDMVLEMVAADLDQSVANTIAKRLVLYARRPGYQSQFSPVLAAQAQSSAEFAPLVAWIREHLAETLDVARLAAFMCMSERSLHRKLRASLGHSPANLVETLRLDQVRELLAGGMALKAIAVLTGYANQGQLSRAFERRFGMTPSLFRALHARPG